MKKKELFNNNNNNILIMNNNNNKSLKLISFNKLINSYCSNVIVYGKEDILMPELFLDVFICKLYHLTKITEINLQYLIDPRDLLNYLNYYIGVNKNNKIITEILYQDYMEIENFYLFYLNELNVKHIIFHYSSISTNNIKILYIIMIKKNKYIKNALEIVSTYTNNKKLIPFIDYELNKYQLQYFLECDKIDLTIELLKENYEINIITNQLLLLYSENYELKQFIKYKPNEVYLELTNKYKNHKLIIKLLNNNYKWHEIFIVIHFYVEHPKLIMFIKYKPNYHDLKLILKINNVILHTLLILFFMMIILM